MKFLRAFLLLNIAIFVASKAERAFAETIDIGARVEMFVDDRLIDPATRRDVSLQIQAPVRREVVLTLDQPWEGPVSAYFTIFQDGPRYRLYYRGSSANRDDSTEQVTCYAESADGIHFTRPSLGLQEIGGSKDNNVILKGVPSHNFAPFLDTNPAAKAEERYKALAGLSKGLFAYVSADGIHWKRMRDEPVMTKGTFDSLNVAFWDDVEHCYRAYSRYADRQKEGVFRSIQHSRSDDFLNWSPMEPNRYTEGPPLTQFYTNATLPCPGAMHTYLSFPKRFMPTRKKLPDAKEPGVSDAVFISSRDGVNWTQPATWLRPGPDPHNWTDRNNMPAWGIVQTSPDEFSMYVSEHYRWPDNRLRRVTVRRHGFVAAHADARGGEFTTPVLKFGGKQLVLNYATSAAGSVQVEVQDAQGSPISGFAASDMEALFGDELDAAVHWKAKHDLSQLVGKEVRFRFVMKDADLFTIRTAAE